MLGALRINFLEIAQCEQHFHTLAVCTSQKIWKTSLCATSFPTHAGGTLQEFSGRQHHPKHVEDMLKAQQRKSARIQKSIK
jgi:hypothetical protein